MLVIEEGSEKIALTPKRAPTAPPQTAPVVVSEHGQGGGSTSRDTGKKPTQAQTQTGYATPASTQPAPAVVSEHGQGGGSTLGETGKKPTQQQTQTGYATPASTQPAPAVVSEHGQGGGSASGDTGEKPTLRQTQTGYATPAATDSAVHPIVVTPASGSRTLSNAKSWIPIITSPPSLSGLADFEKKVADSPLTRHLIETVAKQLHLTATAPEIKFMLQPHSLFRALPTLELAFNVFTSSTALAQVGVFGSHFDPTNGAPDAFAHAAWAGILTLRYGSQFASEATTLHETGTPQSSPLDINARKGDLNNNHIGIGVALAIASQPPPKHETYPKLGIAQNDREAKLLNTLLLMSIPNSGIDSGLVTVGPPGATETQVKKNPQIYSLYTGTVVHLK